MPYTWDAPARHYDEALKIDIGDNNMEHSQYDMIIDRKWVLLRLKTPFERK